MLNSFNFLKAAVKNQKSLGAVAQSSRFLINKIMESIDLRNAKVIVELGAGVGNITKIIARNANSDARIFCFEINRDFCRQIRRNVPDKRVVIINASAEEMKDYLKKFGIGKADVLVSTLPFFNFSLGKKEKILGRRNMKITIGYLYGDLMNIYGDTGNIIALQKRAEWRDLDIEIKNVSIKESDQNLIALFFFLI